MQIWYIYKMKTDLALKIDQSTAHRKSREQLSNYVLRHLDEIEDFIQIAFDPSHKNHVKAFWSLELVCEKKLKVFVPFLILIFFYNIYNNSIGKTDFRNRDRIYL